MGTPSDKSNDTTTPPPSSENDTKDQPSKRGFDHIGTVADQRILPDRRKALAAQKQRQAERAKRDAEEAKQREADEQAASNESQDTGLERRRGPGRRRSDFMRSAEEGEMTQEQFLFLMAIDTFKKVNDKTFPTWTDVLEIVRRLGYRKVGPSELNIPSAEDWQERPDAPAWSTGSNSDDGEGFEEAA